MLIGIDPGHGGQDPGAVGTTGLYEKDITLAIALELCRLLNLPGLETYLVRPDNRTMGLLTRTALINNMNCDLVISIHINSSTRQEANYIARLSKHRAAKLRGWLKGTASTGTGYGVA